MHIVAMFADNLTDPVARAILADALEDDGRAFDASLMRQVVLVLDSEGRRLFVSQSDNLFAGWDADDMKSQWKTGGAYWGRNPDEVIESLAFRAADRHGNVPEIIYRHNSASQAEGYTRTGFVLLS